MTERHVMIDIETASVHTSRAVILSCAAVSFEMQRQAPIMKEKGTWVLDIRQQLLDGRIVDEDTMKWWREQESEAQDAWVKTDPVRVDNFIRDLHMIITPTETTMVWANGIIFDLGNLEELIRGRGARVPWRYNMTRDYRTVVRMFPRLREPEFLVEDLDMVAHDPLSDCHHQIYKLWQHWSFQQ